MVWTVGLLIPRPDFKYKIRSLILSFLNHLQPGMFKLIFRNTKLVDFFMTFSKWKVVVRLCPTSPIYKIWTSGAQKAYPKMLILFEHLFL